MPEHRCEGTVEVIRGRGPLVQCPNKAKYKRKGRWYCGIHDPVRIKANAARRQEVYDREEAIDNQAWAKAHERSRLERAFCRDMTDDELKAAVKEKS